MEAVILLARICAVLQRQVRDSALSLLQRCDVNKKSPTALRSLNPLATINKVVPELTAALAQRP